MDEIGISFKEVINIIENGETYNLARGTYGVIKKIIKNNNAIELRSSDSPARFGTIERYIKEVKKINEGAILAVPKLKPNKKWGVECEKDGEKLFIGETIDKIFMRYTDFESEKDALSYIESKDKLQLRKKKIVIYNGKSGIHEWLDTGDEREVEDEVGERYLIRLNEDSISLIRMSEFTLKMDEWGKLQC